MNSCLPSSSSKEKKKKRAGRKKKAEKVPVPEPVLEDIYEEEEEDDEEDEIELNPAVVSFDTSSWEPLILPENPRRDCGLAVVDEALVLVGGTASDGKELDSVERIDFAKDAATWSSLPSLKVARKECTTAVVGDKLYVFGGAAMPVPEEKEEAVVDESKEDEIETKTKKKKPKTPPEPTPSFLVSCEVLDLVNGTEFELLRAQMPAPAKDMASVVKDEKIYLMGGEDSKTFWSFDTKTDTFRVLNDMKNVRCRPVAAILDNMIVVAGGYKGKMSWTNSVETYDLQQGKWTNAIPSIPKREALLESYTVLPNHVVIFGKEGVYQYNKLEQSWLVIDHDNALVNDADRYKMIGGKALAAVRYYNTVEHRSLHGSDVKVEDLPKYRAEVDAELATCRSDIRAAAECDDYKSATILDKALVALDKMKILEAFIASGKYPSIEDLQTQKETLLDTFKTTQSLEEKRTVANRIVEIDTRIEEEKRLADSTESTVIAEIP